MLRNVYIATLIPFMKHNMNVLLNALTTDVVNNYYFNLYFCVVIPLSASYLPMIGVWLIADLQHHLGRSITIIMVNMVPAVCTRLLHPLDNESHYLLY